MVKTSSYSAWVLSQGVPAHLEACMEELVISCGFSQQLQIELLRWLREEQFSASALV